jgi:hypothetical protein
LLAKPIFPTALLLAVSAPLKKQPDLYAGSSFCSHNDFVVVVVLKLFFFFEESLLHFMCMLERTRALALWNGVSRGDSYTTYEALLLQ